MATKRKKRFFIRDRDGKRAGRRVLRRVAREEGISKREVARLYREGDYKIVVAVQDELMIEAQSLPDFDIDRFSEILEMLLEFFGALMVIFGKFS